MRRRSLQVFVIWLLFTAVLGGEKPSRAARLEWWIQDLEFLASTFPDKQVDFSKLYNPAKFRKEIDKLELQVGLISDSEIVLRLMRLVAAGRVAHIGITPHNDLRFHAYPVRFFWYSDGPALTGVREEDKSALGARIVRIGSMTPEQFEAAVEPYLPHENEPWLHAISPEFMLSREVTEHFGLSAPDGSIELSLVRPTGEPFQLRIAAATTDSHLLSASDLLHAPIPLMHKRSDEAYWYEYLAESHALYIQYNLCQDTFKKPFRVFTQEIFHFVDNLEPSQQVERVIVDLRSNRGGDSRVIEPLVNALQSRPQLTGRGHLYVLISRYTFSAGMMAGVELRDRLHAILIGEPTGSPPNEYAGIDSFVLPNSGIEVQYTHRYVRLLQSSNPLSLEPELPVDRSVKEFLTGRDHVLETALGYQAGVQGASAAK